MPSLRFLGVAAAAAVATVAAADQPFSASIVEPADREVVRTFDGASSGDEKLHGVEGTLYSVAADGYTDGPFYVANITAPTHYGAGYAYGRLLANESVSNFKALFSHEFPKEWQELLLDGFLDFQYDRYAGPSLPQDFQDEMKGLADAGDDSGFRSLGALTKRGLTLASIAVGDVEKDIQYLVDGELGKVLDAFGDDEELREKHRASLMSARAALRAAGVSVDEAVASLKDSLLLRFGKTCSFWGAWGNRTDGGELYSGRNLDWAAQTGISRYKTVSVYHIGDTIPHASIAFAGVTGAITGMSAAGITVHEAGDDNKLVTLEGFAWSLRLRALMETATDLASAKQFWETTNNTMGLNHGVGSATDPGFLALETRAGYTAYFEANDPREADANVNGTHYGFPMVRFRDRVGRMCASGARTETA